MVYALREAQTLDTFQSGGELFLIRKSLGQLEHGLALGAHQFGGDEQQALADGGQREALPGLGQTDPAEPIQQVVREDHELE